MAVAENELDADLAQSVGARDWGEDEERALRLWIALARCYSTMSREISTRVTEYGLTTPQFGVLEALHHLGPLPLGELADKLLVTGGNITYVMDRLAEHQRDATSCLPPPLPACAHRKSKAGHP